MTVKFWEGTKPTICQLCQSVLNNSFVDGATVQGPWAIMCDKCHVDHGRGIGIGRGQRYWNNRATPNRWFKVQG